MNLYDAADSISIKNTSDFNEGFLKACLEAKMPGWRIETWDCDEYNTELTGSVADYIIDEMKAGRTDVGHCMWHTDSEDAYIYLVATHKPKD